jgi:neopullulanase
MHMKSFLFTFLGLFSSLILNAQITRIDPPNWWVNMQNNELQVMIHGDRISSYQVRIEGTGVRLKSVHKADSPNYLFVDLEIGATAPSVFKLFFENDTARFSASYELKSRKFLASEYSGFNRSDAIYLITPDRFVNATPENDSFDTLRETDLDRSHDYKRHGGDINGIINALSYIDSLGFTAIWPGPMLINDMNEQSYRGYAITDHYQVDPRFGSLDEYKLLAGQMRKRNMKLIMDQINNHCGSMHWWMNDLPFSDWINGQSAFQRDNSITYANHRRTALQDLYASKRDYDEMTNGWFVETMPDLNHRNAFLARYIIQNSIWWIETLGLSGIRQDTQPYNDPDFMSAWAAAIMKEYPNFSIVGEEWSYNPLRIAYWQQGAINRDGYTSNMNSVFDFPLQGALSASLTESEGWDSGLIKWYEALSNDFIYPDPMSLVLMADNHDMDRLFTQVKEDQELHAMALALLAVSPRIPQMYYGTEILMQNTAKPHDHGLIRTDFPGGWQEDSIDAFTGKGLTEAQVQTQELTRRLFTYRRNSGVLTSGKTVHYAPKNATYVLSRYNEDQAVTLIVNKGENDSELALTDYQELGLSPEVEVRDVISGRIIELSETLSIPSRSFLLIEHRRHEN